MFTAINVVLLQPGAKTCVQGEFTVNSHCKHHLMFSDKKSDSHIMPCIHPHVRHTGNKLRCPAQAPKITEEARNAYKEKSF